MPRILFTNKLDENSLLRGRWGGVGFSLDVGLGLCWGRWQRRVGSLLRILHVASRGFCEVVRHGMYVWIRVCCVHLSDGRFLWWFALHLERFYACVDVCDSGKRRAI